MTKQWNEGSPSSNQSVNPETRSVLLGSRIAGRLADAEALGWSALIMRGGATAEHQVLEPLPFGAVSASLRLAHVLHWMERYNEAEALFLAALTSAEAEVNKNEASNVALTLVAFAQQHMGKMYLGLPPV